jgi:uncharacterized protein YggE
MYRLRALAPVLVVLLSSALGAHPAAAAASPSVDRPVDRVQVTGTGEVFGEPDMLTAGFAAQADASTVAEAMNRAGTAATRMRDALVHAGLSRADLQTSNIDVSAQQDTHGKTTGYAVVQGLSATIRNLPRAGSIMSEAIAAGGDAARLYGVSFAIEDDTALLAEARRKAFADARAKAELYAREAGRRLGRVVLVSELPANDVGFAGRDFSAGAADAPIAVEPGRQRLAVTVTVDWALQPV